MCAFIRVDKSNAMQGMMITTIAMVSLNPIESASQDQAAHHALYIRAVLTNESHNLSQQCEQLNHQRIPGLVLSSKFESGR